MQRPSSVRRAAAQAASVAPVVWTSSTRTSRRSGGSAARGTEPAVVASRARRPRPTCARAARSRRRHARTGRPLRVAIAAARRAPWSRPRTRARSGSAGTGTRAASRGRTPGGAVATICEALVSAARSRRRCLSATTRPAAGPACAIGAHARAGAPAGARHRDPAAWAGSAQRGHGGPDSQGSAARHGAQSASVARGGVRPQARQAAGASSCSGSARRSRSDGGADTATPSRARVCRRAPRVPQSRGVPVAVAADYSWTLDPGPILLVVVLVALYVPRWRRVRAGDGARAAGSWPLVSWLSGCAVILVALVSPVDRLGEQAFVMPMAQHVLLLDVAPILLLLGLTKVLRRPVPRHRQPLERGAGLLAHPACAVLPYVAVMYAWHVPAMYDAALAHSLVHVAEHLCFLMAGFFYWYFLLSPVPTRLAQEGVFPPAALLSR